MLERTLVFVDTSYLLASFYNSWEEGARGQLEISLASVVQRIDQHARSLADQPVQRQNWYDGIPDSGPHRYQRTLRVIEGVQLRAGQLIEWGDRRTQKAVDTLLVADMITAALRGQCSDMVLVSGDADMIPGVKVAVDAGVRVHLIGFGWDSISSALRHACDSATILDPREDFEDAMQIRVLEGPVPPQVRATRPRPVAPGTESVDDDPAGADEMVEVRPRSVGRASAQSVADEARLTAADEERAADIEEDVCESETVATEHARPKRGPRPGPEVPSTAEDDHPGATGPTPRPTPEEPEPAAQAAPDGTSDGDPQRDGRAPGGAPVPSDGPAGTSPRPGASPSPAAAAARPKPSMMAQHRRPLRNKFVPLSDEVWTSSGEQTPHDVGRQYALWWFEKAASDEQRDSAHLLSGGALPPEIDRPLLQFACQMLNEFTLNEEQRVGLRDGFHEGIRAVLLGR